jgi:hypothetical protein
MQTAMAAGGARVKGGDGDVVWRGSDDLGTMRLEAQRKREEDRAQSLPLPAQERRERRMPACIRQQTCQQTSADVSMREESAESLGEQERARQADTRDTPDTRCFKLPDAAVRVGVLGVLS